MPSILSLDSIRAAVVRACGSVPPSANLREVAKGEVEAQHRAAKTTIAGSIELEAGLKGDALERRTYRLAIDFQSARRQPSQALRTSSAKLDGADDGTVSVDATDSSRSIKTADFEQLADNEPIGLTGTHLFGGGGGCHDETDHQDPPNDQHPIPH